MSMHTVGGIWSQIATLSIFLVSLYSGKVATQSLETGGDQYVFLDDMSNSILMEMLRGYINFK